VRGSRRRNDRIDESRSPERGDAERGEEIIIAGRQKQAVPASADPPPAPPHTLQEGSDRGRSVDLHHPVEIADVDAELERARRDNDAVGLGRERRLGLPPLVDREGAVGHEGSDARPAQPVRQLLDPCAAVGEDQPPLAAIDPRQYGDGILN
jgi:hypothetical protein